MKISGRQITVQIIAAMLIFLFAYAAVSKFFNFHVFRFTLGQAPVIGNYNTIAAIAIPGINLIAAMLLLIPRMRLAGLFASLVLLVSYSAYIAYVLLTAEQVPCSCNGIVPWLSWTHHLWLNLIITVLNIIALVFSKRFIAISQPALANAGDRGSRKPV